MSITHRNLAIIVAVATALTACNTVEPASAPSTTDAAPAATVPAGEDLLSLVAAGKTDQIRKRFSGTESVNQKNAQGQSLLHIAALRNDPDTVRVLLSLGADTAAVDNAGNTPLGAAIDAQCLDAAKALAEGGSSIFAADASGRTVYAKAASGKNALAAILTPKTAAETDASGRTALHHAAADLNENAVAAILAQKPNASASDSVGLTALQYAYQGSDRVESARVAATLLLAGAEPARAEFAYFETAVIKRNLSMRFEEGKTPLQLASERGHIGFVAYLLEKGATPNVKDVSSSTPLHEAVRNGQIECAKLLLAAGADPNQKDSAGNTPLHLVMPVASRSALFSMLLAAGADPNQKDSYGETPLHIAARLGMSEDIIRALVSAGADVNERNKKGVTPLSLAIERKQIAQAGLFVTLGSDIHAEDIDGNTALTKSFASGLDMVTAVVTKDNVASRDSQGRTPLHIAVITRATPDIVNYLLALKADVNARDKNGDTPLHIAVRNNDRADGEILLARGADVFSPNVSGESPLKAALTRMGGRQDWVLNSNVIKMTDGAGNTPLHLAAEWQLTGVVSYIVDKGGDLNARNANGETPLFNAVKADSPETIRALLAETSERKADVNARDNLGNTALHASISWAASRAADELLRYDAQSNGKKLVNARNLAGKTALHEAARTENMPFLRTLAAAGADVNAVDETGKTSLIDAIQGGGANAVAFLIDKGASPALQDMYGRNALHEAVEAGNPAIIAAVRAAGGNPLSRDSYGKTPLSLAFKKDAATVTAVLGTNANLVDSDGNTPIHIAVAERCPPETLKALIAAKYPVNNRNRTGTTAILSAVKTEDADAAEALLAAGADPFVADNQGVSAVTLALASKKAFIPVIAEYAASRADTIGDGLLHYAARIGDEDAVKKLLTQPGVDRGARNVAGETAYDVAVRWQRPDIAKLLQ